MRLHPPIQFLAASALALIFAAPLAAQNPSDPAPTEKNPPKESSEKQEKVKFEELTRVSTEKAVQSAAKEKSKPGAEEKVREKKGPELSGDSQVTEFHPAAPEESAPAGDPGVAKTSKKSRAKNLHGSVSGAGGARGPGAGGEVGATTKSGKTSVYVQSEKSRTTDPNPH